MLVSGRKAPATTAGPVAGIPREALRALLLAAVALLVFHAYVRGLRVGLSRPELHAAAALSGLALAVAGAAVRSADLPRYFAFLGRGLSVVMTLYVAAAYMGADPAFLAPAEQATYRFFAAYKYVVLACGALAWFRPAFFAAVASYILAGKAFLGGIFGFGISPTDYIIVVEFGLFLAIAVACLGIAGILAGRPALAGLGGFRAGPDRETFLKLVVFLAIAAHFANYFYSGVEKLVLEGPFLSWLFDNRTHYLILSSYLFGTLPLGFSERLVALAFTGYEQVFVLLNLLVLAGQLAAPVALWRIRWVLWLTLFYDLMHVGIFIASGIFFWKWIALNTLIVVSLARMPKEELWPGLRLACVGFVLAAELVFSVAHLGWFDTPAVNVSHVVAIDRQGREHPVPSNYFLAASVTFAQQRVGREAIPVLPTGGFGVTKDHAVMRQAEACALAPLPEAEDPDFAALERFIRQHHAYVVARADAEGRFAYDLYPHHIWSNPLMYRGFADLDKRQIVAYRWVNDGVCVRLAGDRVETTTVASRSHLIRLDGTRSGPGGE